jgi:hypothetical protein
MSVFITRLLDSHLAGVNRETYDKEQIAYHQIAQPFDPQSVMSEIQEIYMCVMFCCRAQQAVSLTTFHLNVSIAVDEDARDSFHRLAAIPTQSVYGPKLASFRAGLRRTT